PSARRHRMSTGSEQICVPRHMSEPPGPFAGYRESSSDGTAKAARTRLRKPMLQVGERHPSRYDLTMASAPRPRSRYWIASVVVLILAASGLWVWFSRFATYHFAEVRPAALYRDGNRSLREFATACRKGHIRTVVMLNDDQEVQNEPFRS